MRNVLLGLAAAFVLVVVIGLASLVGLNNTAVRSENGIKAQYTQNQNNYDNFWKKLKESAQVPEMYVADLQKVYNSALQGRYGAGGSKAVFLFIHEHNPQVDATLYTNIQRAVESGRNSFEADQKMLIDKKREYENLLQTFPNSMFAGALGFPKIDLKQYDIVTSEETQQVFQKKKSDPVKLR